MQNFNYKFHYKFTFTVIITIGSSISLHPNNIKDYLFNCSPSLGYIESKIKLHTNYFDSKVILIKIGIILNNGCLNLFYI